MSILRICRECGFPITDDPRIAREQAVCCCEKPKEGIAVIISPKPQMNKRRQRTEQLMQATARRRMAEQADNDIEQARFDRLVRSGVIVALNEVKNPITTVLANIMFEAQRQKKSMLNSEGGGRGKAGPAVTISTT